MGHRLSDVTNNFSCKERVYLGGCVSPFVDLVAIEPARHIAQTMRPERNSIVESVTITDSWLWLEKQTAVEQRVLRLL